MNRVFVDDRAIGRLIALAKRSQARFWALGEDLRRQGPTPLGWPDLTRFSEDCFHCQLDQRLVCGWTLRADESIEMLVPGVSVGKLPFVRERQFEELFVQLLDPEVEVRVQGPGALRFLAQLRQTYAGQVPNPQLTRKLVELTESGWYAHWAEIMSPGRCLNLYRQQAGQSLAHLAERSGVSRRELLELEEDRLMMTEERARTLALYLECDPRSLLGGPRGGI